MKIALIGTGAYALAMGKVLSTNSQLKLTFWTESPANIDKLKKKDYLNTIIPNFEMPKNITITPSYQEAIKDAQIIFVMVAAKYVDDVAKNLKSIIKSEQHVVICSKGIEQDHCNFVHEVWLNYISTKRLAVISGPSFAVDIAKGDPVGLAMASKAKVTAELLFSIFKNTTVKLRKSSDMLGVELCGSIKNVIAMASGMVAGLGYSDSTSAFLINESIHDIKELIKKLGGKKKTILSFAGIGDLVLSCTSTKSRNYSFGYLIGSGASKKEIEDYLNTTTVEGYYTIKSIYNLIKKKSIDMPTVDLIYRITVNNESPKLLIKFLMTKK